MHIENKIINIIKELEKKERLEHKYTEFKDYVCDDVGYRKITYHPTIENIIDRYRNLYKKDSHIEDRHIISAIERMINKGELIRWEVTDGILYIDDGQMNQENEPNELTYQAIILSGKTKDLMRYWRSQLSQPSNVISLIALIVSIIAIWRQR